MLEKYRHQPKIKHKALKCLFTGPPQVGKTTLKKRLLKAIKNLISSGVVDQSGGLEKSITVVIGERKERDTVIIESDVEWQPQHDLLDEAQIVLHFIDQQSTPEAVLCPILPISASTTADLDQLPSKVSCMEAKADTLCDAKMLMQEVLAKRGLHKIDDITTLYLMDTGGQPEFHEIMPLIFNGPALHMVFFNLAFNLDDSILIQFCQQDSTGAMITYKSSYTGKQMIYQLLSNLYCLSKDLSLQSMSAAVLIGTHSDQQGRKMIENINNSLKQLLSNTEFHDQGFLTYPTKGKESTIFIPVNNYSGDENEIQQLQAFLKQVIDDRFCPIELPSSWLLFHVLLRQRYESSPGVCTLAESRNLAKSCGLDEDDVPKVLRYIHQHLGTILFYEEVQGLNELVICDPNLLFRSLYNLVAISFAGDRAYNTFAAEIKKTGEITAALLKHISSHPSYSLLTNEHIISLLKHFKILTELREGVYLMPCLLRLDHSFELSHQLFQDLYPPPLLIRFEGNYIPVGVFSALVVKLSQSSWEPDRDLRYRNHVLFFTDGLFPVELIIYPAYLEFRIIIGSHIEEPEEIHQFCMGVRKIVVDTLKCILNIHEHTRNTKFQLGFYCPVSIQADGQPHFSGCLPRPNYINPKSFVCSNVPRCQQQCRLPHECTIWFDYWKVC